MAVFASLSDVSTRLGRPITDPAEQAQVETWIDDVEALILARIPDLEVQVGAGFPTAAVIVAVEANAVIRKVRNPDGKSSETIDDYSYRLNGDTRRGELFLTDAEWALLLPGAAGAAAFTIRPTGVTRVAGTWVHPDTWVPAP